MRIRPLVVAFCLASLVVAGCGAADPTGAGPGLFGPTPGAVAATTAPAATRATPGTAMTAAQIVERLAAAGTITQPLVQDENTDPNHSIGRPGGYLGRASFDLPGGDREADPGEARRGGALEVYRDAAGAQRRAGYLAGLTSTAPELAGQYVYAHGVVVLRIAHDVTPAVAGRVDAQLVAITGG